MTRYVVNCAHVRDFNSFVAAVNDGFTHKINGHWHGNLDALNDYLSWPSENFVLVFEQSNILPEALGHSAMADHLERALEVCHPSNRERIGNELTDARASRGPALIDIVRQILNDNTSYMSTEWR